MPASSVLINGVRTRRPGAYSKIDGSRLARKGPGIRKLVLIGEAEGGKPVNVLSDGEPSYLSATGPDGVKRLFRSGNLRTSGLNAFSASGDPRIPNGPGQILFYKINPATPGTATLTNAQGDALAVASRDYGAFVNQIGIQAMPGSTKGMAVVLTLEELVESGDDVGGDSVIDVRYDVDGDAATMRFVVDADGARLDFTDQLAASVVVATHNAGDNVVVVSANVYDTVQSVTVYGTDADDLPISEVLVLNGTNAVTGSLAFETVTAVRINGATRGIITIKDEQGPANTSFTIAATLTANHVSGEKAEVVSSDADDVGQVVTVYGYTAAGQPQQEAVVLNGTTAVAGTKAFGKITAAILSAECEGTVTVRSDVADAIAFTITAGNVSAGMRVAAGLYLPNKASLNGKLTLSHAGAPAGAPFVVVRGRSTAGVAVAERFVLTADPTETSASFASLEQIEIGKGEAANAINLAGAALNFPRSTFPYVKQIADAINARRGFHATALVDAAQAFAQSRMDYADASVQNADAVSFYADLDALVVWLNANSSLVSVTRATGASGPPSSMPAAEYLIGGGEGVATASHWQAAFDALKRRKDVVIVPLTTSASVHAMHAAHNRYMEGKGRDERSGFVGLPTTLSKAGLKAAIRSLNDRNLCAIAQKPTRYDEQGAATEYETWMMAVLAAAMRCGAGTAEPLIWKAIDVLSVSQGTDWNPTDDAEEMIELGLMFARLDDEQGIVWERDVTTYRTDDNPIFTAESANDSANASTKRCRRNVETQIGTKGFSGRAAAIQRLIQAELEDQVRDGDIKAFDAESVDVADEGDTFPTTYAIAPMEATVFIPITAYMQR